MIRQINTTKPSFKAKIEMTPYLQEGLYTASNTKENGILLKEKVEFLNALKLISNDNRFDSFKITAQGENVTKDGKLQRRKNIIYQGNQRHFSPKYNCPDVFDGHNCMAAVTAYAKEKYGQYEYADANFAKMAKLADKIQAGKNTLQVFFNNTLEKSFNQDIKELQNKHSEAVKGLPEKFKYLL